MTNSHPFVRSLILIAVVGVFFVTGCKRSGDQNSPLNSFKRYPYERLHLSYTYNGDVRGTDDVYVAGFGKYEAKYSQLQFLSESGMPVLSLASITRISDKYEVDFTRQTISHDRMSALDSAYHLRQQDIPSSNDFLETEMKNHFFRKIGTEMVGGKLATKWQAEAGDMTLWIWNTLLVRKQVTTEKGSSDITIVSIDSLWTVDTTKFAIPTGLKETPSHQHASGTN